MKENDPIPSINPSEMEELIARAEGGQLRAEDGPLIGRLLRLVLMLVHMLESKKASIARLKRLLFGPRSEKRSQSPTAASSESPAGAERDERVQTESTASEPGSGANPVAEPPPSPSAASSARPTRPGHGRLGAAAYTGAATVRCEDPRRQPGAPCPYPACPGHLYDTRAPLIFIRFEGRPVIQATRYEQHVLRCSACQARFAAPLPAGVPPEKYDATADATMALMKYGAGLPFYRLSRLQALVGVPLPPATQFERCEAVAAAARPVYVELQRQAAAGDVLHVDDTGVKILACLKENKQLPEGERKGLHTTGIGARDGTHEVALYFSGRPYSGENLAELIKQRPAGLAPPIVMADAEAKNWTKDFQQVVAKCLAHGRRQFVDVAAAFPAECRRVLDDLADVYRNDAKTRAMTPEERLAYHQTHSEPILTKLRQWIETQLAEHRVEPNSGLGHAMSYFLRHYEGLTCFLSVAGAPLDNNFVERILKRAVLHRKNALFYKTQHGAALGDLLMSVIETCALNQANAFDYLVTLIRQARAVRADPAAWLPWNYRQRPAT